MDHVVLPCEFRLEEAMRPIRETNKSSEQLGAALYNLTEASDHQRIAEQVRDKVLPFDVDGALQIVATYIDDNGLDSTPVMELAGTYHDALGYNHTILEILERAQARHHAEPAAERVRPVVAPPQPRQPSESWVTKTTRSSLLPV